MADEKSETNEVAISGQFDLNDVPMYLQQVQEERAALEAKYKGDDNDIPSSTVIEPFGDLATINDVGELVKAHSLINGRAKAYKASAKDLEVSQKTYPFRINGVTVEKMSAYIKRRIGEVTYEDEIRDLKAMEADLLELSSEEDKKKARLASLGTKLVKYAEKKA